MAPVPGPISPATAPLSSPHVSVWFVTGVTHSSVVAATLAVKSPGLLLIVKDVPRARAEFVATNVPLVTGVV